MAEGWYYLHVNGDLIYKAWPGTSVADLRESDFVRAFWPFESGDREKGWSMLVEALASGARPERVADLSEQWGMDDDDALEYARRINLRLLREDGGWVATEEATGRSRSGSTPVEAMAELAKAIGYQTRKMWGEGFPTYLARRALAGVPLS